MQQWRRLAPPAPVPDRGPRRPIGLSDELTLILLGRVRGNAYRADHDKRGSSTRGDGLHATRCHSRPGARHQRRHRRDAHACVGTKRSYV